MYISSNILFVLIANDLNGSFKWTIFEHWPIKNFLKTRICALVNSMFLNTTVDGAYERQAILKCFIISAFSFVQLKQTGSIAIVPRFFGYFDCLYFYLAVKFVPVSLNFIVLLLCAFFAATPTYSGKSAPPWFSWRAVGIVGEFPLYVVSYTS